MSADNIIGIYGFITLSKLGEIGALALTYFYGIHQASKIWLSR